MTSTYGILVQWKTWLGSHHAAQLRLLYGYSVQHVLPPTVWYYDCRNPVVAMIGHWSVTYEVSEESLIAPHISNLDFYVLEPRVTGGSVVWLPQSSGVGCLFLIDLQPLFKRQQTDVTIDTCLSCATISIMQGLPILQNSGRECAIQSSHVSSNENLWQTLTRRFLEVLPEDEVDSTEKRPISFDEPICSFTLIFFRWEYIDGIATVTAYISFWYFT